MQTKIKSGISGKQGNFFQNLSKKQQKNVVNFFSTYEKENPFFFPDTQKRREQMLSQGYLGKEIKNEKFISLNIREHDFDFDANSVISTVHQDFSAAMSYVRCDFIHSKYSKNLNTLGMEVIAETRKELREAAEKEAAEKSEEEKRTSSWISIRGSERLKTMVEQNYKYRKTYELERGKEELPGFTRETEENWKSRANPSEKAMSLTKILIDHHEEVRIVWVEEDEENYEHEAIVIRPIWSRFYFMKGV